MGPVIPGPLIFLKLPDVTSSAPGSLGAASSLAVGVGTRCSMKD